MKPLKFRVRKGLQLAVLIFAISACGVFAPPATPGAVIGPSETPATAETAPNTGLEDPDDPSDPPDPDVTKETGTGQTTPPQDLDTLFEPFWEARELLHEHYVNQPIDDSTLVQGAIDGILNTSDVSDTNVSAETLEAYSEAAGTPPELEVLFKPFWETWIRADHADDVELLQSALGSMVDSLGDQHTSYLDPDELFQASTPIEGSYEGIGAWVDPDAEYLTIVTPMPGSPAEEAGLLPGDQIIAVDGDDMTGVDGNLVIRRVLGPAGSEVTLTIRREGVEDFNVTITRAEIIIPSIEGRILEEADIAYIQLFSFGETTGDELRELLEELLASNPAGLILDLRNNGGGLLSTAIEVGSEFIEDGVLLHEEFGDGTSEVYEAFGDGLATEIPLVVLINSGSASASEIVAGAIQDYERGQLVGTTSFGKGSVQFWLPLPDDGAIRVTIALWYTPEHRQIHETGLIPDVEVELTEEDVTAGEDPQLDAAVDMLSPSD